MQTKIGGVLSLALVLFLPLMIANAEEKAGRRDKPSSLDGKPAGRVTNCDPPPRLAVTAESEINSQRRYVIRARGEIPCPAGRRTQVNLVTRPNPIVGLPGIHGSSTLYIEVGGTKTPTVTMSSNEYFDDATLEIFAWMPAHNISSPDLVLELPNPNPQVKDGERKQIKPQLQQQVH